MLQQTQVSRVEEYYPRFLSRVPHAAAPGRRAARARSGSSGTASGYYRRAANLHALARRVVLDHAGTDPGRRRRAARPAGRRPLHRRRRAFLRLRAVGRGRGHQRGPGDSPRLPSPARRRTPRGTTRCGRRPSGWCPAGPRAWTFNQAIMELGALVCTARVARCGECPVEAFVLLESGRRLAEGCRAPK